MLKKGAGVRKGGERNTGMVQEGRVMEKLLLLMINPYNVLIMRHVTKVIA